MSKTRVRGHTRTSKNGKKHHVHSHDRNTIFADIWAAAKSNKQAKTVGWAALGTASLGAFTYTLYGLLSLTAAVMCAIAMVSIGFITWAVGASTKKQHHTSWMKRKFGGPLSPRRRIRSWWHGKKRTAVHAFIPNFIIKAARK